MPVRAPSVRLRPKPVENHAGENPADLSQNSHTPASVLTMAASPIHFEKPLEAARRCMNGKPAGPRPEAVGSTNPAKAMAPPAQTTPAPM